MKKQKANKQMVNRLNSAISNLTKYQGELGSVTTLTAKNRRTLRPLVNLLEMVEVSMQDLVDEV